MDMKPDMGLQAQDSQNRRSLCGWNRRGGHCRGELTVLTRNPGEFNLKNPRHIGNGVVNEYVHPRGVDRRVKGEPLAQ
jgi:hypothetical protein